jgi:hypothetical protein
MMTTTCLPVPDPAIGTKYVTLNDIVPPQSTSIICWLYLFGLLVGEQTMQGELIKGATYFQAISHRQASAIINRATEKTYKPITDALWD